MKGFGTDALTQGLSAAAPAAKMAASACVGSVGRTSGAQTRPRHGRQESHRRSGLGTPHPAGSCRPAAKQTNSWSFGNSSESRPGVGGLEFLCSAVAAAQLLRIRGEGTVRRGG